MDAAGSESRGIEACVSAIAAAFGERPDFVRDPRALSAASGAYLVVIGLAYALALSGRFDGRCLHAGAYVYCGSAHGPGGIRARVARHMRRDKALRWHVDQATSVAVRLNAAGFSGTNECDLVRALSASGDFGYPLSGFGSSDCRSCTAHLLQFIG